MLESSQPYAQALAGAWAVLGLWCLIWQPWFAVLSFPLSYAFARAARDR
jgi:hypothetical protein